MTPSSSQPILLVSEGISFCHIARPLIIGRWLKELHVPIIAACTERSRPFFVAEGFETVTIEVADPTRIYQRLARGSYIYEADDFFHYYQRDTRLLQAINPALVVADFRFTMLHLAKQHNIRSVGITSASCHPHFPLDGTTPNPFIPKLVPPFLLDVLQKTPVGRMARRLVLKDISRPYQVASSRTGLAPLGSFFDYASQGDLCLLCDHPEVMPLPHLRPQDLYTGALVWSLDDALPQALHRLDTSRKTVYITVGTQESLHTGFLTALLPALLAQGLNVIVSKGHRQFDLGLQHEHLFVFDFINESKLFPLIDLYIYHGSAMSTYQGLYFGVPMLAIPSQADQHYHAEAIVRLGTGRLIRPVELRIKTLLQLAIALLEDHNVQQHCQHVQRKLQSYSGKATFLERLREMLDNSATPSGRPTAS